MFMFLVSALIAHSSHADNLDCYAKCVVLQTGADAREQINARPRAYESKVRLVKRMGRVFGDSFEALKEQCEERARNVTWWKPGSDNVFSQLVRSIEVDDSDDAQVVISMREIKECEPL